jgi:hypothetical protein
MTRKITAATIRNAALEVRLPLAARMLRMASLHEGTFRGASYRVAARYVLGNVDSAGYDLIARLQVLEAAVGLATKGPNAGTWWKKGRRGLAAAKDYFADTNIDPSWLSNNKTGFVSKTLAMITSKYSQWTHGGSGVISSPADILQNGLMGLTKDGMKSLSTGPLFLSFAASSSTLGRNIKSGKDSPSDIAGAAAINFVKKVADEFKLGDQAKARARNETETGESKFNYMPSEVSSVTFLDFLMSTVGDHTPEGKKLEADMRRLSRGHELANALIDKLVKNESIGSISALSKSMGGSGSGGSVRWVKKNFLPLIPKLIERDKGLLMAFWRETGHRRVARRNPTL